MSTLEDLGIDLDNADNLPQSHIQNYDIDYNYKIGDQNIIKAPNLWNLDLEVPRRQMLESARMAGTRCAYFQVDEIYRDLYQDPIVRWKDSILIDCIFDDSPKVRTLKDVGWFSDDEEERPPLLYLPMYKNWVSKEIFPVIEESLVRVFYFGQPYPTDFRITNKKMDSLYGVYWLCKLAPEHLDNFYYITEHGSHYLKRRDREDQYKCDHSEGEEPSKIDDRVYQNEDFNKYTYQTDYKSLDDTKVEPDIITDETKSYYDLIMEDDG